MDDHGFNPQNSSIFGNMDYDFMEQLLDEGCWLQTADGSSFLQPGPSTSRSFSFPSYRIPSTLTYTPHEESERWSSLPNIPKEEQVSDSQYEDEKSIVPVTRLQNQPLSFTWEGDEINRILWIEPKANTGPSTTVKDRLMLAVSQLKELNKNRDVLIQIWVPVKKGLTSFLTTVAQPYFLQPNSASLLQYRDVSERYEFLADEDSKQALGLPGRVFLGKVPEWTPDVRFFKQDEYPRSKYAHQFDVRGSIALPVFEKGSGDCLGVVEIIMTTEKFNYRPEIESVCQALENVHLRSSEILYSSQEQPGKGSFEAVKPEILNVLKTVSDAHDLPLAQTWASCSQQGKGGCWISDNQNALCVSTIDSACYVRDQRVLDFHTACSEHHLLRGRGGIIGKAFDTNQLCFATDVTEFSKADYPLSHHAKMFGLRGAVAIRLQSIYHDSNEYVLEFFLPTNLQEGGLAVHGRIWQTLTMAVQQNCHSLKFITVSNYMLPTLFSEKQTPENETKEETSSWISHIVEPRRKGKEVASLDFGEDEPGKEFKFSTNWSNSEPELQLGQVFSDSGNVKQSSKSDGISGVSSGGRFPLGCRKSGEKRRTKAQKTISLQVLRQYFAGSLKDAAKNIGVCPTTLKRICRQHGIARWPSRKIKKVGHSLKKLQLVIDSVQGTDGSIQLSSFYTKFPELNSSNTQLTDTQAPLFNLADQSKQQPTTQAEGSIFSSGPTTSNSASTSSSQTSTSSQCFLSGSKMSSPITTDDISGSLKRARSEAELQILPTKEHNKILERTHSSKAQIDHRPPFETIPDFPIPKSLPLREAGVFKAKATFGEEKVRFTVLPNMGFQRFQQEIATRFNLVDLSMIGIKYLDDDHEWVLLTCDADLEECIDIHRSSGSRTIRLTLSRITSSGGFTRSRGFP